MVIDVESAVGPQTELTPVRLHISAEAGAASSPTEAVAIRAMEAVRRSNIEFPRHAGSDGRASHAGVRAVRKPRAGFARNFTGRVLLEQHLCHVWFSDVVMCQKVSTAESI